MLDIAYIRPDSLDDAIDFLSAHGEDTEILAGGTDVMIDLKSGGLRKNYLLDVSRLEVLKGIDLKEEGLCVGAGVTLSEISASKILFRYAPALQKCALTFASQQIRNVATIGGNVAHCSPCGDTIPPLVIHEARAVLVSSKGQRVVPIEDIASGPYVCSLSPNEMISHFILKPADRIGFADFQKIGRRKGLAIARISMAGMAGRDPEGRVAFIRFSLGSCTPTPMRMAAVENYLAGKALSEADIWEAGKMLADHMVQITGKRSSVQYKVPAIQGLFVRMFYPLVNS